MFKKFLSRIASLYVKALCNKSIAHKIKVRGIIAGGYERLVSAGENAEDSYESGCADVADVLEPGDVLVIGSEGKGISPDVAARVTRKVSIPAGVHSGERAESLNASIAAAIVMYEACGR